MSMSKNKYFIVNDRQVADIMGSILNQKYYLYNGNNGETVYCFIRVDGIDKVYGKAKGIVERYN